MSFSHAEKEKLKGKHLKPEFRYADARAASTLPASRVCPGEQWKSTLVPVYARESWAGETEKYTKLLYQPNLSPSKWLRPRPLGRDSVLSNFSRRLEWINGSSRDKARQSSGTC